MSAVATEFTLSPRAALWLKGYAVAMMVLDHIDTGLLDGAAGIHATLGRTVFPIFAFLLAYNLARAPDGLHLLRVVAPRMAVVGILAMPAAAFLWPHAPLNVMFTLALGVVVVGFLRIGWKLPAAAAFLVGGALVDYGWFGVGAIVLAWWLRERGDMEPFILPVLMAALLIPINGSWWAALAMPLIAMASYVDGTAPRAKWLFYGVYPAHLVALAVIAYAM